MLKSVFSGAEKKGKIGLKLRAELSDPEGDKMAARGRGPLLGSLCSFLVQSLKENQHFHSGGPRCTLFLTKDNKV